MASNKLKILDDFPSKIPTNKLPSNADIIKAICFERDSAGRNSIPASIKVVQNQVYGLWQKAMIPIIGKKRLRVKLNAYFDEYSKLCNSDTSRKSHKIKLNKFKVILVYYFTVSLREKYHQNIVTFRRNYAICLISLYVNAQISENAHALLVQKFQWINKYSSMIKKVDVECC